VTREARRWVVRLHSHEVDAAEAEALRRWRARSPVQEHAFAEANLRWNLFRSAALNVAAQLGEVQPGESRNGGVQPATVARLRAAAVPPRRIERRAMFGGALAASVAGVAYLAMYPPYDQWPSLREVAADYRTATGQQRQLVLAATVSLEMNTQTSLSRRPAQAGAAAIELISGEVAVTAKSPVVVIAGGGSTRAEQGAFNLRRDENMVSVTCLTGEAKIGCGGHEVALRPGQRVVYDDRGLGEVTSVNPGTVEAWRRGLLIFEETPVAQVIAEINRYRHGRVILMNQALAALPVDAVFRLDQIDAAVPRLAEVFGAKVRALPGGIVLLS
jgi:transmembrane sensor